GSMFASTSTSSRNLSCGMAARPMRQSSIAPADTPRRAASPSRPSSSSAIRRPRMISGLTGRRFTEGATVDRSAPPLNLASRYVPCSKSRTKGCSEWPDATLENSMPLTEHQTEQLRGLIDQRRGALLGELREDAERAREQPYAEHAGPAPDTGDESVATLIADLEQADVTRDLDEFRGLESARER